jgi:3-oxoacyl-[acyl-carrier-protein] synthase-3
MVLNAPVLATARHAAVLATASALPDTAVTNQDIITRHGHTVAASAIRKIVGVESRRVAAAGVTDSDLLAEAARRCLARAGMAPERLSKLIATKFLGDRLLPPTASLVQRTLGTSMAFQAFDVDGGTNAFLQAIDIATAAIAYGDDYVLVVSGGITNTLVTRDDPRQAFLYGDGAGAVLLGLAPDGDASRIHATYQFTEPAARDHFRGFELRKCMTFDMHETKDYRGLLALYGGGEWKTVQQLVLTTVDHVAREVLARAGFTLAEMDLVLLTENHHRLWGAVLDHLGIARSKSLSLVSEYGNTMSAMLPLLLDRAVSDGRLLRGQRILLLSIGEGLSCGALVATF